MRCNFSKTMTKSNMEIVYFDKVLKKVQAFLKPIGLQIDEKNNNITVRKWLRFRWAFIINMVWMNTDITGQSAWLIQSAFTGKSFVELTNLAPCLALCLLGDIEAFFFMKHGHKARKLVRSIRILQSLSAEKDMTTEDITFLKGQIKIFHIAVNSITVIITVGIIGFGISPFVNMAFHYKKTSEFVLNQPFLILYPFDINDIRFYFIAYFHIMWTGEWKVLKCILKYFY